MAANPSFFILVPSSVALPVVLRAGLTSKPKVRALIPLAAIDRRLAESNRCDRLGHAIHRPSEGPRVLPPLGDRQPRAGVIFLHGFGEHTGVYHRYGFALNAAGIDLWAVDQFGHGLSPGTRGDFGSIDEAPTLADTLTEVAEGENPGLPLIAQGHSFGSVVTLFRLLEQPDRYRAGVISGAPLVPIPEMLDGDSSFDSIPPGSLRIPSTWTRWRTIRWPSSTPTVRR